MVIINGRKTRAAGIAALLSLASLAACAPPAAHWRMAPPVPCAAPARIGSSPMHGASGSARDPVRLYSPGRDCATERPAESSALALGWHQHGVMGMSHRAVLGAGIMVAVMAIMMITMW